MANKCLRGFLLLALLVACTVPAGAQESAVKGNLGGTIYDPTGAVVPGAKVTLQGPTVTRTQDSDEQGGFLFTLLIPGLYSIRVEKQGFKVTEVKNIEVVTNSTKAIRVNLEAGAISQTIEVVAPAIQVDTTSTAIGANLPDSFYSQV